MEEDNRVFPRFHPFRHYERHRIMEPDESRPQLDEDGSNETTSMHSSTSHCGNGSQLYSPPLPTHRFPVQKRSLPFLKSFETAYTSIDENTSSTLRSNENSRVRGMVVMEDESMDCGSLRRRRSDGERDPCRTTDETNNSVRGMIPIDDDDDDDDDVHRELNNKNDLGPSSHADDGTALENAHHETQEERRTQDNSSNRLLEETNGLLRDYQRRFYRQSLTDLAKTLLHRAITTPSATLQEKLKLCKEALAKCKTGIRDQEEALHGDDRNHVGGSYLLTGDIRIRRKGELLAAKIYCVRAGVHYTMEDYTMCLEDCDAAIEIWKQHEQRSGFSTRLFERPAIDAAKTHSATAKPSSRTNDLPRKGKLSHKHLFLLKGRALAAMGRYKDAAEWLTHPKELPIQKFHGTSQLLQNDARMHRFVHALVTRSRGKNEAPVADQECGFQQPTTPPKDNDTMVLSNKKLWAPFLHSVDKRLHRGPVSRPSPPELPSSSSSSSAIYQVLRHGPVLFHHFE